MYSNLIRNTVLYLFQILFLYAKICLRQSFSIVAHLTFRIVIIAIDIYYRLKNHIHTFIFAYHSLECLEFTHTIYIFIISM